MTFALYAALDFLTKLDKIISETKIDGTHCSISCLTMNNVCV